MIPEDMIMGHLNWLLEHSEPGDTMHHMIVVSAGAEAGPFGVPDEAKLEATVYAIAPDETVDAGEFIRTVVMTAAIEHHRNAKMIVFAAMSQEVFAVEGASHDLDAEWLHSEGRLFDHPNVAEATMVYGACSDGRRWFSRRWLTGPKAGQADDVELLVGRPHSGEGHGMPAAVLIRKPAGL